MTKEAPTKETESPRVPISTDDRHAENFIGDGRTLCGLALEGFGGGDEQLILLTAPGSRVTCPDCMCAIRHVYVHYTVNGRRR